MKIKSVIPNNVYLTAMLVVMMSSCDSTKVYEDFTDFEEAFWHQDSKVSFTFDIEDASQPYNLLAHFRNSLSYPYHNMYYKYVLKDQNDSILSQELKQIFLFDAKTGEPNGSGLGDYFDNSQMVLEKYTFREPGQYNVEVSQYMRMDSLPFILSVGWRVETTE